MLNVMSLINRASNSMKSISINNQEIAAGENKTVILNSYELHTKSSIKIPVHVIRSKNQDQLFYSAQVYMGKKLMVLKLSEN